ncbi:TPA: hypothetical protein JV454_000609 [Escherichia coli]|nr:hypothetical protein [Escherichia coli]
MKKNVVIRKFRKLINNPKAFFADAKIVKKVASNNSHNNDGNHGGKHVFGDIVLDGKVGLSIKTDCGCKPINYDFSSLLVKVRKCSLPKNEPIYSNIISYKNDFIGFRDNNIFLLNVNEKSLSNYLDMREIQNSPWNTSPFSGYKNIFIVDPANNLPLFLKSTSPFLNIHCIFTENVSTQEIERCLKWSKGIDVCIIHSKHSISLNKAKKIYTFCTTNQLIDAIHNIILIHGAKPFDLLVPCFGHVPYIENIDSINESDCDVYIKLRGKLPIIGQRKSFYDFVSILSKNIEYILCRESIMQRYENIIMQENISYFISEVSFEGFRLEIEN